jgi:two-component system, sensor histidine kinase and response regulator
MKQDTNVSQYIPNILIVDDIPANLKVLGDILKGEGYKVRPVPGGTMALAVAEKEKPDLILLDIMMPDMDGFEVCRRIKEKKKLRDIPIIFISALNDTKDVVKAFKSGGVDFITKPFQAEEVTARVNTHLKLYLQSIQLKEQSKSLQELNATKDKFFSIIAHDLRGPLGGFMGLSEMLVNESMSFTDDQKKEMNKALSRSSRNIFNLLENLLEWSQMQHGQTVFKPCETNLLQLVTEGISVLTESTRNKGISLVIDISDNQMVYADTNMLQSVIRNLVSNAIKFTPNGGIVSVTSNLTDTNTSVITVSDTGIGMNNEMISNLFRLNVNSGRSGTAGEHSTGLGLLLCKEFVERHGGELWVESEEGKGSLFCFTVPGNKIPADFNGRNEMDSTYHETDHSKKLKVLVAEDNENSELLIKIILSPFCNQLIEASTGFEAIDAFRDNPDIDLIMMDINMPEMNGLEATRQIRKFNNDVIIIAQTAFEQSDSREKALNAGANDYISKPLQVTLLMELIKKYFELG